MLARSDAIVLPLRCRWLAPLVAAVFLGVSPARAGSYVLDVRDQSGAPVENAVVVLLPAFPVAPVAEGAARPSAVMDQRNKQFEPRVLAVRAGTAVVFPNSDAIRHHVYSFSPAKRFELKLYKGVPAAPVIFDRPGPVVLGCNIHDQMVGYIYVAASQFFASTGSEGRAQLDGLPAGRYRVEVWHPRIAGENAVAGPELELGAGAQRSATQQIELGEAPQRKRALSPLEQKFRDRSSQ